MNLIRIVAAMLHDRMRPRGRCTHVRRNGLIPQSEPNEDVRGHMQRMRGVRRDVGIPSRGLQAETRELRTIRRVDEVVSRTRVIRLLSHQRVQHVDGTAPVREIVNPLFGESDQRERIEGCGLSIVRELSVQAFKLTGVRAKTPATVRRGRRVKERGDGSDVAPLAKRRRASTLRADDVPPSRIEYRRRWPLTRQWVEARHRLTPMAHRTRSVAGGPHLELLTGLLVLE